MIRLDLVKKVDKVTVEPGGQSLMLFKSMDAIQDENTNIFFIVILLIHGDLHGKISI